MIDSDMLNNVFMNGIGDITGLAILALFAFIMLKSQLKALSDFNKTLQNHFKSDQEFMSKMNETALAILNELKVLRDKK